MDKLNRQICYETRTTSTRQSRSPKVGKGVKRQGIIRTVAAKRNSETLERWFSVGQSGNGHTNDNDILSARGSISSFALRWVSRNLKRPEYHGWLLNDLFIFYHVCLECVGMNCLESHWHSHVRTGISPLSKRVSKHLHLQNLYSVCGRKSPKQNSESKSPPSFLSIKGRGNFGRQFFCNVFPLLPWEFWNVSISYFFFFSSKFLLSSVKTCHLPKSEKQTNSAYTGTWRVVAMAAVPVLL